MLVTFFQIIAKYQEEVYLKEKKKKKKYYLLWKKCLQISRHQSLFQQIQWMWQEELLYSIVLLLLKINWASFFRSFLWRCYRLFMLHQGKKTFYWKWCFKNLNKIKCKNI